MRFAFTFAAAALVVGSAAAQDFPSKPVRFVTSEAGGNPDIMARLLGQGLSPVFNQPVVVENKAGGVIAGDTVAKSPPDGHTLLFYGDTLWLLPLMRKQVPYDPHRDFLPVTLAARAVNVLVVHPSLPVKSVQDLITFARARPKQLNYSSAALGTTIHLAAEVFNSMAKTEIVRVGYRGGTSAVSAVATGEVQVMFANVAAQPFIKSGRLRPLGVTSANRSSVFPELPTIAEAGLPGFDVVSSFGIFTPAKTPDAIVTRLNREIVQILQRPATKERLGSVGLDIVASTPADLATMMKNSVERMGKVIREAGIEER